MANKTNWRSRIVERKTVKVSELKANPFNPRIHPQIQKQRLKSVLDKFGIVSELITYPDPDDPTKLILFDGHARQGLDPNQEWPVIVTDLSPLEAQELSLYFDPISALAQTDMSRQVALMQDLHGVDGILGAFLDELARESGFVRGQNGNGHEDAEPQIDKAAELQKVWGTQVGQIWQLGEHRLAVGDCTDRAVVESVMRGERYNLMVTDPPYGVDYEGGRNPVSNVPRQKISGDSSPASYNAFLSVWKDDRADKGVLYIWFADRGGKPVYEAVKGNGFEVRALIIWNKIDPHYGNFMAQYMQKHEPCLYCVKDGTNWYGTTNEVTVWDIKQPNINEFHPTQKPIECMTRPMENSSKVGDIVADPFLGSGTTLIACEQLGRRCRACELDPGYAAVSIQRFFDTFGIEGKLDGEIKNG